MCCVLCASFLVIKTVLNFLNVGLLVLISPITVDDAHVGKEYSFYTGYEIRNMPTMGKFNYEGDAFLLVAIATDDKGLGTPKFEAD